MARIPGEEVVRFRRKRAREMIALTLQKAFSLEHGARLKDAEAYEKASREFAKAIEQQAAWLMEQGRQMREANLIKPAEMEEAQPFKFQVGLSAKRQRDLENAQAARAALARVRRGLEPLAWAVAVACGAPERLERGDLARACGLQKSAQDLETSGDVLENRLDGYELRAKREGAAVVGFEAIDWDGGLGALVSDAPRKGGSVDRFGRARLDVLGIPGKSQTDSGSWAVAMAALSPRGAEVPPLGLRSIGKMSDMSWSRGGEQLEEAAREMQEAVWAVENGAAFSMAAQLALDASQASDAEAESTLAKQLGAPLRALMSQSAKIAGQDKAARVCEWFDGLAGERSNELALKVWGDEIASGLRLSQVELLAKSSRQLWAALEGQEALGLFSIRMAEELGLELSGRDLPERAKAKMKASFGLSDGAWRLLGKMDCGPESEISSWTAASMPRGFGAVFLMDDLVPMGVGHATPLAMSDVDRRKAKLEILGLALSACASRGIGPEGAQKALKTLRMSMDVAIKLFGPATGAPEGFDAQPERSAKRERLPRIMGDWVSMAAKDATKAGATLSDAADWAIAAEWGAWSEMPERSGWAEVVSRQKRWHEQVLAQERGERAKTSWDGLIEKWSDPQTGFSAISLTDGGMLWDEGKAMHHCVSTYADKCESGRSRIFSIRKDGERFGTAEVRVGDGSFEVVQFRGRCNGAIDDERAWAAAKGAALACKEALAAQPERLPIQEVEYSGEMGAVVIDGEGAARRVLAARQRRGGGEEGAVALPGAAL